jgi:hypothetical protein
MKLYKLKGLNVQHSMLITTRNSPGNGAEN